MPYTTSIHRQLTDAAQPHPSATVTEAGGMAIFADGDIGAAHATAHRMLDAGRIEEGHRLLGRWLAGRRGEGSEWIHIQFHMAVFELELGRIAAAADRFVKHLLPAARYSDLALTDAPALAWRLWLALGEPADFPWEPIRARAEGRLERRDPPYVDLHHALAFAGADDRRSLDRWLSSRRRRACTEIDHLGLRVAQALAAWTGGDHAAAARELGELEPRIAEIGGSRAQNALFGQIARASRRHASGAVPADRMTLAA